MLFVKNGNVTSVGGDMPLHRSEVQEQMAECLNGFEKLLANTYELRSKLIPILNESKDDADKGLASPEPVLCPLATELRDFSLRINRLNDDLRKMYHCIEL